jgi:excisionase family DNA binding protein
MSDIMTIKELAVYLRVHKQTIYRLVKRGSIPTIRIGHQWRFEKASIDKWLRVRPIGRSAKILVVDDDGSIRALFAEILGGVGYQAAMARDAREATELFSRSDFNLVFLDLLLPDMDGAELLKKLRAIKPDIPVIIITGYPDSGIMSRALVEGPFGIMRKPFTEADIVTALSNFLHNTNLDSTSPIKVIDKGSTITPT